MKAYPQGQVWVRFPFVRSICLLSTNVSFPCRVVLSPFSALTSMKSTTPLSNSRKPSPIPRQRSFLPTTLSLALSVKASFFPLRKSHTDVITPLLSPSPPSSLPIAPHFHAISTHYVDPNNLICDRPIRRFPVWFCGVRVDSISSISPVSCLIAWNVVDSLLRWSQPSRGYL